MKLCGKCNTTKDISDFPKSSKTKDGVQSWCRLCMNEYNAKKAEERKINGPSKIRHSKVCKTCGLEKPINQFHKKNGHSADGYGSYCKPCWSKAVKHWANLRRYKNG